VDVFRRSFISGFVQFWSKNLSENTELAEVGLNGKTILKFVIKSVVEGEEGGVWMKFSWNWTWSFGGSL
jgi:hypothetical protein